MGDEGDLWRAYRKFKSARREKLGVDCPGCRRIQPRRIPTRLLPGQKCKVCGYRDPRKHEPLPRVVNLE